MGPTKRPRWLPLVAGSLVWLSGCTRSAPQAAPPAPTAPAATTQQTPPQGATAEIVHYDLAATITPSRHLLSATVRVDWEVVAATDRLRFGLRPDLRITALSVEGAELRYDRAAQGEVTVTLPQSVAPGRKLSLTLTYEGPINGPRGGARNQRVWDYIGLEGTYVRFEADWYPIIAGDVATADLRLTVPAGWKAVSCGELQGQEGGTFRYRVDQPAAGLSFAAAPYEVTEGRAGEAPVLCYTSPAHRARGPEFVQGCTEILGLFGRLYGPYPFPKFAIAEIPNLYGGGHGDQSFIMLQERTFTQPFDGESVAHEMAHDWWGNLVTCTETEFLAEGFATYSQALWREEQEGSTGLRASMQKQAQTVLVASMDPKAEASCYASDSGPRLYEKGAWILHMLRRLLGDEKWFATVRGFAEQHAGQVVTCKQLEQAFQDAYGAPLDWFFQQWLYGRGVPWVKGEVRAEAGNRAAVTLTQSMITGPGGPDPTSVADAWQTEPGRFRLLVEVAVQCAEGQEVRQETWLDGPTGEFTVEVPSRPARLVVDPDGWLLEHGKGLAGGLDAEMDSLDKQLQRELGGLTSE